MIRGGSCLTSRWHRGGKVEIWDDVGGGWDLDVAGRITTYARDNIAYQRYARWLPSLEPETLPTRVNSKVETIGIDPNSLILWEGIVADGPNLTSLSEAGLFEWASQIDHGDRPPPRNDFIATYSRTLGGYFVGGGLDPLTSVPKEDLFLYRFGVGWQEIRLEDTSFYGLRDMVYSPKDRLLWLYQEVMPYEIRVLSVDPWTNAATSYGPYYTGGASAGNFALALDGSLLWSVSDAGRNLRSCKVVADAGVLYCLEFDELHEGYFPYKPLVGKGEYGYVSVDPATGDWGPIVRFSSFDGVGGGVAEKLWP